MKTQIFVCTHKPTTLPCDDAVLVPLQVGAAANGRFGITSDDTGDNISSKNCFYGELTGLYWIWKNVTDADIVGLCHYRRYFLNPDNTIMTASDIEAAMADCDVILSNLALYESDNYHDGFCMAHRAIYLEQTGDVIRELFPDDYPAFKEHLYEDKSGHFGNLCIMRKPLLDQYCTWLFAIFSRLEKIVDLSGLDDYHRRLYGFLSEGLLDVFVKARGLKVKDGLIGYTEEKAETRELKLALTQLVRMGQFQEARALYYQIMEIRPDVRLALSDIKGELGIIEIILYILELEKEQNVDGLYSVSHDLSALVNYMKESWSYVKKEANGEVLTAEELKSKESHPLSELARSVIAVN